MTIDGGEERESSACIVVIVVVLDKLQPIRASTHFICVCTMTMKRTRLCILITLSKLIIFYLAGYESFTKSGSKN